MNDQPQVTFQQTATKTEVTTHYSVQDAPAVRAHSNGDGPMVVPRVVRFVFRDGEMENIFVNGLVVKKNGDLSNKWQQIAYIFHWNQRDWPSWLVDLLAVALEEYRESRRAEVRDALSVVDTVKTSMADLKDA